MTDHDHDSSNSGADVAFAVGMLSAQMYRPPAEGQPDPTAPLEPPRFKDPVSNREALLVVLVGTVIVAGIVGIPMLTR